MRRMMMFQVGARGRFQQIKESYFAEASIQELFTMRKQHDTPYVSTKLSQEQLQEMMRVIEEVRLNRYKETL